MNKKVVLWSLFIIAASIILLCISNDSSDVFDGAGIIRVASGEVGFLCLFGFFLYIIVLEFGEKSLVAKLHNCFRSRSRNVLLYFIFLFLLFVSMNLIALIMYKNKGQIYSYKDIIASIPVFLPIVPLMTLLFFIDKRVKIDKNNDNDVFI